MPRKPKKPKYVEERNGSLRVKVPVTDSSGKRTFINGGTFRIDQYVTPGACYQAAIDSRDRILQMIKDNKVIVHEPTMKELYDRRTKYIRLSVESQRKHDIIFKSALEKYGNKKISAITAANIQECLTEYGETHSTSAVKHMLSIWRSVYRVATIEEYAVSDKTLAVIPYESKVVPAKRGQQITYEEFQTFLDHLSVYGTDNPITRERTEKIYYALMIQLYAGLRPQEAYALFREDIDLGRNTLHVRRRIGSTATETRQIITLKTGASSSDLPISSALRPILEEVLQKYHTEPLLADYDGLPFDTKTVATLIRFVSQKAGIHFTQYQLRHLFAKQLSAVADIKTVQSLMRHANPSMSLYYSWSSEDEMQEALEKRQLS